MLVHLLALQITAAAASVPAAAVPAPITVTGHRLQDYAAALDTCVAAHCPPREDIIATVRYAEALFRSGDYHGAREVLAKSARRNADVGAQEPLALSQLYVAQANVAEHFGEQSDVRRTTLASARVADDFLPVGDPDRLNADLRAADWRLASQRFERVRNLHIADSAYMQIAAEARAAGHADLAAAADLHLAWAMHARRDDDGAARVLAGVTAAAGDAARPYRLAAQILTARIARDGGDRHAIDAAITAIRAEPDDHPPVLVYSPPLPKPTDPADKHDPISIPSDNVTRPGDLAGLQWIDIGFAIRADGTVDDPQVLRGSRSPDWVRPLLTMIAARRYSATVDDGAPGHYRVERYTLTADFGTPTGSLIRRRIFVPHYERLDLTDAAPTKRAAPAG